MKHRRKIWSIPIAALALVLMLVGALAVSGIVQAFGDKPKVETQIEDQNIQIGADPAGSGQVGATDTNVTINLADVDGEENDAFTDVGTADGATIADPLVYTVLTYNYKVAFVELDGVPDVPLLTRWWDSLGNGDAAASPAEPDTDCSKRAARLGFTAGAALTPTQVMALDEAERDPNPHRAGRTERGDGESVDNAVIQAVGLCADYALVLSPAGDDPDVFLTVNNPDTDAEEPTLSGTNAILQAFHWDMLSGAEMAAAAKSGGLPGNYAKTFADLTPTQRVNVETLYNDPT